MIKKIIRPFWSLNVLKTEKWLEEMSTKGYKLKNVNFKLSKFTFEKTNSYPLIYRICYNTIATSHYSPSLKKEGWIDIFSKGKWSILGNYNDKSFIKLTPSRNDILHRNNTIKYALIVPSLIIIFWLILSKLIFLNFNIDTSNEPFLFQITQAIITTLIWLIPISLILLAIKINHSNKILKNKDTFNTKSTKKINFHFIKNFLVKIKEKNLIMKFKFAWTLSPDKTANWLENMELQGYNLHHIGFLGLFMYFTKGTSRKIKYFIDFQSNVSNDYFEINEVNGWKICFKTNFSFPKHIIWSKKYVNTEPKFYSDSYTMLDNIKKQTFLYSGIYSLLLLISIYGFVDILITSINYNELYNSPINTKLLILQFILIFEFSYFLIKSLTYYLRVKKSINSNI